MAGTAFERLVGILLIVAVVVIVILASTGKLYALADKILDLDVDLEKDLEKQVDGLYNLYVKCRDSGKTNCKCIDDKKLDLSDKEVVISKVDDGIKIFTNLGGGGGRLKIVSKANYCYLNGAIYEGRQIDINDVSLYMEDGKLLDRGNEDLGNMANPVLLYKWNRNNQNFICITSSEYVAKQLQGESCF